MQGEVVKPLSSLQALDVALSQPKKPEEKSSAESATGAVSPSGGRSVALGYDVELGRVHFYGTVGVKLEGEHGSLGFRWCHHEPDTNVKANVPRAFFAWTGGDKDCITETIPPAMGPERKFRFFASYDAWTKRIGGMLLREDGMLMWDTGDLPTNAAFQCDRLKVEVTPFEGSEIRHDPDTSRLFLRGVSGGPLPSPYINKSWVSDIKEVAYANQSQ